MYHVVDAAIQEHRPVMLIATTQAVRFDNLAIESVVQSGSVTSMAKFTLSFILLLLIVGCSGRKLVYLPDGRSAYVVGCESAGWQSCYAAATKVCRSGGYELLQRQYERKIMYYRCKPDPASAGKLSQK